MHTLTAEILVENKPMVRVFQKLKLPMEVTTGEEVHELVIRLKWHQNRGVDRPSRSRKRERGRGGHKSELRHSAIIGAVPGSQPASRVRVTTYLPTSSLARTKVSWESTGGTRPGPRSRSTGPCSNRSSKV